MHATEFVLCVVSDQQLTGLEPFAVTHACAFRTVLHKIANFLAKSTFEKSTEVAFFRSGHLNSATNCQSWGLLSSFQRLSRRAGTSSTLTWQRSMVIFTSEYSYPRESGGDTQLFPMSASMALLIGCGLVSLLQSKHRKPSSPASCKLCPGKVRWQ